MYAVFIYIYTHTSCKYTCDVPLILRQKRCQVAPDGAPGPAKARREGGVTGGGYILKEPFWEIGK